MTEHDKPTFIKTLPDKLVKLVMSQHKFDRDVALVDAATIPDKPLYVQDIESCAAAMDKTDADIMAADRALFADIKFPSPDCLMPDEIVELVEGGNELDETRHAHFATCGYCQAVVSSASPSPEFLGRLRFELSSDSSAESAAVRESDRSAQREKGYLHVSTKCAPISPLLGAVFALETALTLAAMIAFVVFYFSPSIRRNFGEQLAGRTSDSKVPANLAQLDQALLGAYRSALSGNTQEVIAKASVVLADDPPEETLKDALALRGEALYRSGDTQGAIKDFQALTKLEPNGINLLRLAVLLQTSNKDQGGFAAQQFNEALATDHAVYARALSKEDYTRAVEILNGMKDPKIDEKQRQEFLQYIEEMCTSAKASVKSDGGDVSVPPKRQPE